MKRHNLPLCSILAILNFITFPQSLVAAHVNRYTGRGTFVYFESLGRELSEHLKQAATKKGIKQLPMQCLPSQPSHPGAFFAGVHHGIGVPLL